MSVAGIIAERIVVPRFVFVISLWWQVHDDDIWIDVDSDKITADITLYLKEQQ